MKVIITLLLVLSIASVQAQKVIINGQEGNRKLTWDDFRGKPDKSNPYFAYTTYKIGFKVEDIRGVGDSLHIGKFEITLELDPAKTWAKKDKVTDELLVHEQGHFNIGLLHLNELVSKFREVKLTKSNYNYLMQKIPSEASVKYNQMTLKYDEETRHFADKEQQKKWNAFFAENLSTTK